MIPSPAAGLMIYNTTANRLNVYNGSTWYSIEAAFITSTSGTNSAGGGVAINAISGTVPDNSAILDVNNPTRGILIPRTTPESIPSPATGLIIYNPSTNLINYYNGTTWVSPCAISTGVTGAAGSQTALGVAINTGKSACTGGFTCGQSLIISHVAGPVAPVNKTTAYGTVTNIPGEASKCWITSNLGSDHQATDVTDTTEASAGWYWQFNLKKGYKPVSSTITAGWTITVVNENSDWLSVNDPCNPELGTGWRLPTYTEWYNVDNTGGWTNAYGPWGSGMKLHAAGYIEASSGLLYDRGTYGLYWSSTQYSSFSGWDLCFWGYSSIVNAYNKAHGFPVRCIKND